MMDEKIMLLGTLPPPIGGVTVHIRRLMGELKKEGVSFSFVDLRPPKVWSYGRSFLNVLKCDETIIHYSKCDETAPKKIYKHDSQFSS